MPQPEQDCRNPICKDSPFGSMRSGLSLEEEEEECPLSRSQLGKYSWSLIHSMAAYYPSKPSQQDQRSFLSFLQGFKALYPCVHCRGHFKKDYERDPPHPHVADHKSINLWVCRQHNYVNKLLGKGLYDCEYGKLMERWKTGCDSGEDGDL